MLFPSLDRSHYSDTKNLLMTSQPRKAPVSSSCNNWKFYVANPIFNHKTQHWVCSIHFLFPQKPEKMYTCICAVDSITCICCLSPDTDSRFSCDEFWLGETLLKGVTAYHTVKRRDRNSLYMGDIYQRIHRVKLNRPCCRTWVRTSKINLQIKWHKYINNIHYCNM